MELPDLYIQVLIQAKLPVKDESEVFDRVLSLVPFPASEGGMKDETLCFLVKITARFCLG